MRIWKYSLVNSLEKPIDIPEGADILCVQMQNDEPMLWAKVNPDAPKNSRMFYVAWTGEDLLSNPLAYIGTVQKRNGIVAHVFEVLTDAN